MPAWNKLLKISLRSNILHVEYGYRQALSRGRPSQFLEKLDVVVAPHCEPNHNAILR